MTSTKIPLTEILRSDAYAIKLTSAEQVQKLVPGYNRLDDMAFFFDADPMHREFVSPAFGASGTGLFFCHPEGKEVIDFNDVEFDI